MLLHKLFRNVYYLNVARGTAPPPPDGVLGQPDLSSVEVNRGREAGPLTLYWPYGISYQNGLFSIADTGNRRVLIWNGLPEPEQLPDEVLGQDDFTTTLENRGDFPSAKSFRWPHGITQKCGMTSP